MSRAEDLLGFSGFFDLLFEVWNFFFRPPSKRQTVGSVVSPADSTPAAPAESGGSGSARGQSTSGQTVVPKFAKAKRFVLKHSSQ